MVHVNRLGRSLKLACTMPRSLQAPFLETNSRLGCQIVLSAELGMTASPVTIDERSDFFITTCFSSSIALYGSGHLLPTFSHLLFNLKGLSLLFISLFSSGPPPPPIFLPS